MPPKQSRERKKINWKPNKWIALVLGVIGGPLGVLYAGYPLLAALLLALTYAGGAALLVYDGAYLNTYGDVLKLGSVILFAGLSFELARRSAGKKKQPWYAHWYGLVAIVALVVAANVLFRVFLFEPFKSVSASMAPTIRDRSHLIVEKAGHGRFSAYGIHFGSVAPTAKLQRGDIIAFDYPRNPEDVYVMRIVGQPGDTVAYRDRKLYVNGVDVRGKALKEYIDNENLKYLARFEEKLGNTSYEIVLRQDAFEHPPYGSFDMKEDCTVTDEELKCLVPAGRYFVLGDHRDNSNDSRFWGFVPHASIIGKVVNISH